MPPPKRPRKRQRAHSVPHPLRRTSIESDLSPHSPSHSPSPSSSAYSEVANSSENPGAAVITLNDSSSLQGSPASDDVIYNHAVLALLHRLQVIRADVLSLVDEHLRAANSIEQQLSSQAIAASAASHVKAARYADPSLDFTTVENAFIHPSSTPPSSTPGPPSLSPLALITEPPPSEKLIREQSIIIRAQAITRKNSELARERLPKQPEAQRNKTWRDYFLDEVVWMATDFREERKWKLQLAKKVAKNVQQYHIQKSNRLARAKLEEHQRTVKLANAVARDIRKFWTQIREIADFRLTRAERARHLRKSQDHLQKFLERTQRHSKELALRFQQHNELQAKELQFRSRSQDEQPHLPWVSSNATEDFQVKQVRFADQNQSVPKASQHDITASTAPKISVVEQSTPNLTQFVECETNCRIPLCGATGSVSLQESAAVSTISPRSDLSTDSRKYSAVPNGVSKSEQKENSSNFLHNHTGSISSSGVEHPRLSQSEACNKLNGLGGEPCEVPKDLSKFASTVSKSLVACDSETDDRESDARERDRPSQNGASNLEVVKAENIEPIAAPPTLLHGTLRTYQISGMQWLINLYINNSNGILADEMGLGKTIQTISLLAWLAFEKHIWGPHLIIVPTSVMVNWEVEFKRWLPGFKVLTYFGGSKERRFKRRGWTDPDMFHVCITSYALAVQDIHILRRRKWVYIILDEAHNIKNFRSQRWQTLLTLTSQRRLLLTGTPLQNSVMELWSLMHFLMPNLFESQSEFKDWFSNPIQDSFESSKDRSNVVNQLQTVLRPFVLRRLKVDVEKGLPPKFEHIIKCRLSKRQRQLYEDFISRSDVRENLNSGDMFKVMNILMQLRKVCNHPDLFEGRPILSPLAMNPIFFPVPASVVGILTNLALEKVNLGLLGLDMCSRELSWPGRWHSYRTQSMSVERSISKLLRTQVASDEDRFLHSRGVLSDASVRTKEKECSFKRASLYHFAVLSAHRIREKGLIGEDARTICTMTPSSLIESLRFKSNPIRNFVPNMTPGLVNSMEQIAERANFASELFVCCFTKVLSPVVEMRYRCDDYEYSMNREAFMDLSSIVSPYRSLFRSYDVRSQVTIPDKRLIQWDCGKLQVLDTLLRKLRLCGSRVLIFTQMTKMLDLLESFLNLHTLRYLRLDGATKTDERQKVVHRFNTDMRIFCMILTTRAGGVGLNLTGADIVIFYDTDYNPAVDNQAQDRAHRIGQTKPVHVYRLVSQKTVEEGILARSKEKQLLETKIISEAGFTTEAMVHSEPSVSRRNSLVSKSSSPNVESVSGNRAPSGSVVKGNFGNVKHTALGVDTAQGSFFGFQNDSQPCCGNFQNSKDALTLSRLSRCEEYEKISEKVLGDDEREQFDLDVAEKEQKLMDSEFDDHSEYTNFSNVLSPVHAFALHFIEGLDQKNADDDHVESVGNIETVPAGHQNCTNIGSDRLSSSSFSPHHRTISNHKCVECSGNCKHFTNLAESSDLNIPDAPDGIEESELFYELDASDGGRLNYLKALTDADVDFKIYLPLRDGGPEEPKVSTVVCGTAAAGLECAEDAAFFPHAYNRMSRTQYATRRQKEKTLSMIRKRMAEKDARKTVSDNARPCPVGTVKHSIDSSKLSHGFKDNEVQPIVASAFSRKVTSSSFPNGSDCRELGANERASAFSLAIPSSDSVCNGPASSSCEPLQVTKNGQAEVAYRGLSTGERKFQKQKHDTGRGNVVLNPRKFRTPTNIEAGTQSGLFKKQTKKVSRKTTLNNLKGATTGTLGGVFSTIGKNDRWTTEEDEKLISLSEIFSNNMLLVADSLSSDGKVAVGIRQRRTSGHCTQRFCKLAAKDKTNQSLSPMAEVNDSEAVKKYMSGISKGITQKLSNCTNEGNTETGEIHVTQKRAIAEAKAKAFHEIHGTALLTALQSTLRHLKDASSHRAGLKPREATQAALHRRKRPFIQPLRDELNVSTGKTLLNLNGNCMQVNGSGLGVTGGGEDGVTGRSSGPGKQSARNAVAPNVPAGTSSGAKSSLAIKVGAPIGPSQELESRAAPGRVTLNVTSRNSAAEKLGSVLKIDKVVSNGLNMSGKVHATNNMSKKGLSVDVASSTFVPLPAKPRSVLDLNIETLVPAQPRKDSKRIALSSVRGVGGPTKSLSSTFVGLDRGTSSGIGLNGVGRPPALKGGGARGGSLAKARAGGNRPVADKQKEPRTPGDCGRGVPAEGVGRGLSRLNAALGTTGGPKATFGPIASGTNANKFSTGDKVITGTGRGLGASDTLASSNEVQKVNKIADGSVVPNAGHIDPGSKTTRSSSVVTSAVMSQSFDVQETASGVPTNLVPIGTTSVPSHITGRLAPNKSLGSKTVTPVPGTGSLILSERETHTTTPELESARLAGDKSQNVKTGQPSISVKRYEGVSITSDDGSNGQSIVVVTDSANGKKSAPAASVAASADRNCSASVQSPKKVKENKTEVDGKNVVASGVKIDGNVEKSAAQGNEDGAILNEKPRDALNAAAKKVNEERNEGKTG